METLKEACQLAGFSFSYLWGGVTSAAITAVSDAHSYPVHLQAVVTAGQEGVTFQYDTDVERESQKAMTKLATWAQYVQDKKRVAEAGFTVLQDSVDEWGNPVLAVEIAQEGGF
jgi:hypothetical protein